MTIVGTNPDAVIGGVGTHVDTHVAAAVNHVGGVLGVEAFPTTRAGYRRLVSWLRSHCELTLVGVERPTEQAPIAMAARMLNPNHIPPERASKETVTPRDGISHNHTRMLQEVGIIRSADPTSSGESEPHERKRVAHDRQYGRSGRSPTRLSKAAKRASPSRNIRTRWGMGP